MRNSLVIHYLPIRCNSNSGQAPRVNCRCRNIRMAQKHLQVGDLNASIEQIRCVGVPEDVGGDRGDKAAILRDFLQIF